MLFLQLDFKLPIQSAYHVPSRGEYDSHDDGFDLLQLFLVGRHYPRRRYCWECFKKVYWREKIGIGIGIEGNDAYPWRQTKMKQSRY